MIRPPPSSTLFPYTPLSRSSPRAPAGRGRVRSARARPPPGHPRRPRPGGGGPPFGGRRRQPVLPVRHARRRSEEHTSELQSRLHLVCRLLLEKKKKI